MISVTALPPPPAQDISHLSFAATLRGWVGGGEIFDSDQVREICHRHKAPFSYRGMQYCSRSEAACAALLERYIPGFKLDLGRSYQVPIGYDRAGNLRSVDFMVEGILLEYHPPRMYRSSRRCGDFSTMDDYFEFRRELRKLPRGERRQFRQVTKEILGRSYYEKRRAAIDENIALRNLELVVATSPAELYDKVILRLSPHAPSKERFLAEFDSVVGQAHEASHTGNRRPQARWKRGRAA